MKPGSSTRTLLLGLMLGAAFAPAALAQGSGSPSSHLSGPTMVKPSDEAKQDWRVRPAFTVGETISGYTPPGVLDGLGAYSLNRNTVRVLANHELANADGYAFTVLGSAGQSVPVTAGSRISYFDINQRNMSVDRAGLAMRKIYNRDQDVVNDMTRFDGTDRNTFSRFCSSSLYEPNSFGKRSGLRNRVYFAGEEDGGGFSEYGGGQWALDTATGNLWAVPDMGRGAWENVTQLDTGDTDRVAFILSDDTSPFTIPAGPSGPEGDIPFDTDKDGQNDGAPLYLYVGEKRSGDFLDRNGLKGGSLYVWVARFAESVAEFNGTGNRTRGRFAEVVNSGPDVDKVCPAGGANDPFGPVASGKFGPNKDDFGYASQRCLWYQARTIHNAFQFSRPEDLATNPRNGSEFVLASTGREGEFNNADVWGTMYTMDVDFDGGGDEDDRGNGNYGRDRDDGRDDDDDARIRSTLKIVYDANDERRNTRIGYPSRDFGLRSADNLDWSDNGLIYVQEDAATEQFGKTSGEEASIWQLNISRRTLTRIAQIDRSVVLDPSTQGQPIDDAAGQIGNWESSGILDVSELFHRPRGRLFVFDVQAHGIDDQERYNADSRIRDRDLREGGQLLFLERTRH